MTKRTRNILFLFFVLLFFIITPLASLYTAGYKINLSWPPNINTALQKTGMFVVETEPEGAKVLIDGKNSQSLIKKLLKKDESARTPAKIKNILPGKYDVRIELNGYWSWQKQLSIYPGQTTQIKDIQLFKKDLPIKITDAESSDIKLSPNQKYLAFIQEEEIIILNLENENKASLKLNELYSGKNYVSWSPDSKKILVNNSVIKIENNFEINLSKIISNNISNLKWSQDSNNTIYYQEQNTINSFDIESKKIKKIYEGEICLDYAQDGNNLVIISQCGDITKIKIFSLEEEKIIKELNFPYSSDYKLRESHNNFIQLYDNNYKILYLINPNSYFSPLEDVINNVKNYQWLNSNTLLYYNDFEIWTYNIETRNKDLITRISDEITSAVWHPNESYVIYSTEKNINIIELNKTERRNIIKIIEVEKIKSPQLDSQGELIYLWAKIGNQEGIYKLEI